ncbi:hypothetical protein GCM10022249_07640 [Enteractinococcus coprophilus]
MLPEMVIRIAAGLAIAEPAPSHPGPNNTATSAVAWSGVPNEKIVLSGRNIPTTNAQKNANQSHATERLVGIIPRDAGTPKVTHPIAIRIRGKVIVTTHAIGTVVPIISRGTRIQAARMKVPTHPPEIPNLCHPVGTPCCDFPI